MHPIQHLELLLTKLKARAVTLEVRSKRISWVRLLIFVLGAGVCTVLWVSGMPSSSVYAGLGFLVIFIGIALVHDRVEQARKRLFTYEQIQREHLGRLRLDWDALPAPGPVAPKDHPAAVDLDLTGPRSLLHILDTSSTVAGRSRLNKWFLVAPEYNAIPARQEAVQSLVRHRRFRDRLALKGRLAAGKEDRYDHRPILNWSALSNGSSLFNWRTWLVFGLCLINLVLITVHISGGPNWWLYSLLLFWTAYGTLVQRIARHMEHMYKVNRSLSSLIGIMTWIEGYLPRLGLELAELGTSMQQEASPSRYKRRMSRLSDAAAFSEGELTRIILNFLVPYSLIVMLFYERLLSRLIPLVERWIDTYAELEALNSLATYADFRKASCVFPELILGEETAVLHGTSLAHPLLDIDIRISNDARYSEGQVAIITGSNMSGKSTYLRAVGIACIMAWAGGPVCARAFSVSPMRVHTSMRIGDVLQDGKSTFYAEVERLAGVMASVEDSDQHPVLVLLDEILRGTNTKERLIGAQSIVRSLAGSSSIALVATHDQEITLLASEYPEIVNFHFREHLDQGRLVFDYKMHEGPSDTTNALIIMRDAGLPVR